MSVIFKIVLSGLLATTVMTVFSYGVSYIFKKNYKEPVLLNTVLDQLKFFPFTISPNSAIGWVLHYLIGLIFTLLYTLTITFTHLESTKIFGIGFGIFAGILGIVSWKWMIKIHTYSPRIDEDGYFAQLLVAHILFGWSLALLFNYFDLP